MGEEGGLEWGTCGKVTRENDKTDGDNMRKHLIERYR